MLKSFRFPLVFSLFVACAAGTYLHAEPAAQAQGTLQIAGTFTAFWGGGKSPLVLTQNGTSVSGTYTGNSTGKITGTLSGNVLRGTWFGDKGTQGQFVFTFSDTDHFTGTWGNGQSSAGGGAWNGSRS